MEEDKEESPLNTASSLGRARRVVPKRKRLSIPALKILRGLKSTAEKYECRFRSTGRQGDCTKKPRPPSLLSPWSRRLSTSPRRTQDPLREALLRCNPHYSKIGPPARRLRHDLAGHDTEKTRSVHERQRTKRATH